MKIKLIIGIGIMLFAFACKKEIQKEEVVYRINSATSVLGISYRNEAGLLVNDTVPFESLEDNWSYTMQLMQGEIVYLAAIYHDSSSSVNVEILIDGKIYKQQSSVQEPEKYVIVSGVVPIP